MGEAVQAGAGAADVNAAVLLCEIVQDFFAAQQFKSVCLIKDEIFRCLDINADKRTSSKLALLLSQACSATGQHIAALASIEICLRIENVLWQQQLHEIRSGEEPSDAGARDRLYVANAKLGRAHTTIGNYIEAEPFFQRCVALRGNNGMCASMVPCLVQLAENMYQLEKHDDAIPLLRAVLGTMEADLAEYREDVQDAVPFELSVCPMMLLGRCLAAVGRFTESLRFLHKARDLAQHQKNPLCLGEAELNFAVVFWGKQVCNTRAKQRTAAEFRDEHISGPALPPAILQKRLLQKSECAYEAAQGRAGKVFFCILLNAHGDAFDVRVSRATVPETTVLVQLEWDAAPLLPANLTPNCTTVQFKFSHVHAELEPVYGEYTVGGTSAAAGLCSFLQKTISLSQTLDKETARKIMATVMVSLLTAQKIASKNGFFSLFADATLYLAFALFGIAGGVGEKDAIDSVKEYIQLQVEGKLIFAHIHRCRWCFEQADHMELCGGCRVVRFCSIKHQHLASKPAFGSMSFRHRDLCKMMQLCKSLTKKNTADEKAALLTAYDEAVLKFLRKDIWAQYAEKYDLRADALSDTSDEDN